MNTVITLLRAGTKLNMNTHEALLLGVPTELLESEADKWVLSLSHRVEDDEFDDDCWDDDCDGCCDSCSCGSSGTTHYIGQVTFDSNEEAQAWMAKLPGSMVTQLRKSDSTVLTLKADLTCDQFASTYTGAVMKNNKYSVVEWNRQVGAQLREFNVGVVINLGPTF